MTLSTMALMEYLDGADRASLFFANLPEVRRASTRCLSRATTTATAWWTRRTTTCGGQPFGSRTALAADGNNNGIIDAADYAIWRDHLTAGSTGASAVPEPATLELVLVFVGGQALLMMAGYGKKS